MNQQKALPLRPAYRFGEANGLASEVTAVRNRVIEWELFLLRREAMILLV